MTARTNTASRGNHDGESWISGRRVVEMATVRCGFHDGAWAPHGGVTR
jgi:hypothetical protein